ncbi:lytic transglycosylase domain-containing protein [Clostridium sp.]|uniref:lytic transglycosylase domain-containing protein n=1 Tax=Clostridium sp. TaxID=1506 RepID=UPI00261D118F|nr:lytic transglycosylase domain-containing protein [Clostridium sp.]
MKIPKVEEYIGSIVGKQVLKKAAGDGYEFEIIYEALLNSEEDNPLGNIISGNATNNIEENSDNSNLVIKSSNGLKLDDIPLTLRSKSIVTGEVYLKEASISENITIEEVNYSNVDKNLSISGENSEEIQAAIEKYANKYGVDKNLVLAIIKQESNFNPNAESTAGAKGLMQLMDFNSEAYGLTNPYDINQNIEAGIKHIKTYLGNYNGDLEMALMAYNGGPGTMQNRGISSSKDLYKMPKETQKYVPSVLAYYNSYKNA